MRESEKPLNLRQTIKMLRYIGDPLQPAKRYGGFDEQTVRAARSALYHINRLRKKIS